MSKFKVLRHIHHNGVAHRPGAVIDLSEAEAASMTLGQIGPVAPATPAPPAKPAATTGKPQATGAGDGDDAGDAGEGGSDDGKKKAGK